MINNKRIGKWEIDSKQMHNMGRGDMSSGDKSSTRGQVMQGRASLGQATRESSWEEVTFPQRKREAHSWQREQRQLTSTAMSRPLPGSPLSLCPFSFPLGFLVEVPFGKSLTQLISNAVKDLYRMCTLVLFIKMEQNWKQLVKYRMVPLHNGISCRL